MIMKRDQSRNAGDVDAFEGVNHRLHSTSTVVPRTHKNEVDISRGVETKAELPRLRLGVNFDAVAAV
jgi:hypothetical protein